MNQTPRWHLSKLDLYNSLFVLLHALVGALLTVLIQWAGHWDLGQYQWFLAGALSYLSSVTQKWADGPACPPSTPTPPTVVTPVVPPTVPTA